ncbi:MAG TPA: radical SAM protein [Pseudobacteroides sp.]|uniref:B12-binding domain-containing radical SAM protein n=1 Tax=Pseudobacteroides sp. TaxID=1968840 RepID=UPI002F9566AD
MKKKILLIQPTPYDPQGKLIKKSILYFVGLSLPLLAALTPKDYEVELCYETIEDVDFDTDASLIGISSMGHGVLRTIDIAKEFKKRGKTVILGGYMVSLMPEEAAKYCDSVVIGDAEEAWKELLEDYRRDALKKVYKKQLQNLSTPLPRYDLIVKKRIGNFLPVQAGRGCPNTCSFCSVFCLYKGSYLKRDIDEVIRDIKEVKRLGFKRFLLLDDNIFSDRKYAFSLCREIRKLNMKWMTQCSIDIAKDTELLKIISESGCMALSFGLESISKESLRSMNKAWADPDSYGSQIKIIQSYGIDISTEMVVGAEGDTLESISATADFITANGIMVPRFYILTPIPGTKYYYDMMKENRIYKHDIYRYNGTEAVHIPKNMSPEELTDAYWSLYREVFSYGSIIRRTLLNTNSLKRPFMCIFYFFVNLYYRRQIYQGITPNIF